MIGSKKVSRERAAILDLVSTSSKLLTSAQAQQLLRSLNDPMEKVSFYSRIMTKIVDDSAGSATFLMLSHEEQQVFRFCHPSASLHSLIHTPNSFLCAAPTRVCGTSARAIHPAVTNLI
jgi:hypothetical protein